ncbi:MAG: hypothetical protein ABIN58_00860 [candidate division WOR-3 bacterium]
MMACNCSEKEILRILRGPKGRDIYIALEGLDWDLLNPPPGYAYDAVLDVRGENNGTLFATIVNSNTIRFALNANEEEDFFYDLGMYNLRVKVQKKTDPGGELIAQVVLEADSCIQIYDEIICPPAK